MLTRTMVKTTLNGLLKSEYKAMNIWKMMKISGLTEFTTEELKNCCNWCIGIKLSFHLNAQRIACIGFQYKHHALINALRGSRKRR